MNHKINYPICFILSFPLLMIFACSSTNNISQVSQNPPVVTEQVAEEEKIEACFEAYKSALTKGDGKEACKQVDSKTIAYYNQAIVNAKTLDSSSVAEMDVMDKLMILAVRHRTPVDLLYQFNGADMIAYGIENGMIGQQGFDQLQFSSIETNGNNAKAFLDVPGAPMPMFLEFNKEDQAWKFDLTSIFEMSRLPLAAMIESEGLDENDFIITILDMATEDQITNAVWHPVKE